MNKLILLVCILSLTACSKPKIQMDKDFSWNLDIDHLTKIYPIQDEVMTSDKEKIFTSNKNITSFVHQDIMFVINRETNKPKYITFRGLKNFNDIEKYAQDDIVKISCSSLSGTPTGEYYYGFINTDLGESRFVFSSNLRNSFSSLSITKPDTSINDDEDTWEKRRNNVSEKCN